MAGTLTPVLATARRVAWAATYSTGPRVLSAVRKRWQIFCNPNAKIRFGSNVFAGPGFRVIAPNGGSLIVGNDVEFRRNTTFELATPGARVEIGDGCHLTYDVIFQCSTTITLGDGVMLGQNTIVVDGSHNFRDLDTPMLDQGYSFRPITIEREAVVHSKVTVINNIGERAIIGSNAVITKPIPRFTVAAGVPARVIDYYGPPGQEPDGWPGSSPEIPQA